MKLVRGTLFNLSILFFFSAAWGLGNPKKEVSHEGKNDGVKMVKQESGCERLKDFLKQVDKTKGLADLEALSRQHFPETQRKLMNDRVLIEFKEPLVCPSKIYEEMLGPVVDMDRPSPPPVDSKHPPKDQSDNDKSPFAWVSMTYSYSGYHIVLQTKEDKINRVVIKKP